MIIPVAFEVSRKEDFEDYVVNLPARDIIARPSVRDMRVTVKLFDTEAKRGLGFSAKVLIDHDAEPLHEMMTMFQMRDALGPDSLEYLRNLRKEIDRVLEEHGA